MPNGTLMRVAISTTNTDPMMALPMPPPTMPAAGGSSVNSARLSRSPPRHASMISTEKSGTDASTARTPHSTLMQKLNSDRGWRSDFSSRPRSIGAGAAGGETAWLI